MNMPKQLTESEAKAFFDEGAWECMTLDQRAEFQLFQDRLCMPFDKFHEAIEHRLGRGVWTYEFIDADNLRREMMGEKEPPSLEDIMNLIPAEKRIVIVTD